MCSVANRIQQIRNHSDPEQWRYVSSKDNPADSASRGLFPSEFVEKSAWLTGPEFLWERNLPRVDQIKHSSGLSPDDPELKRVRIVAATTVTVNAMGMVDCWERFSSWTRLRRVVALCLIFRKRLLDIVRAKRDQQKPPPMPTQDVEMLPKAEDEIVKSVQQFAYAEEIATLKQAGDPKLLKRKSPLFKLHPYVDDKGISKSWWTS